MQAYMENGEILPNLDKVATDTLTEAIWRIAFVCADDKGEYIDPEKELGLDFISEVIALLIEAGIYPDREIQTPEIRLI